MSNVNEKCKMDLLKEELNVLTAEYRKNNFKRLTKLLKHIAKQNMLDEHNIEYVSLKTLENILWSCTYIYCEIIDDYFFKITKNFNIISKYIKVYIKDSILYVKVENEVLMSVDCSSSPRLIEGDEHKYDEIKMYICDLSRVHNEYVRFLDIFENTIEIGKISKITISNEYGISHPNIILEIGDIALFKICNDLGTFRIFTFSNDLKINKYLNEKRYKLFEQIWIPIDKITNLLNEYKNIIVQLNIDSNDNIWKYVDYE